MNDKEIETIIKKEIKEATKLDKSNIIILVLCILLVIYYIFASIILKEIGWLFLALAWIVIGVQDYFYIKSLKIKDYINNRQSELIKFLEVYINDKKKVVK